MFLPFFDNLRKGGVPVSLREYLAFLDAMALGLVTYDTEGFYYLARTAMVKDERNLDKFDRKLRRDGHRFTPQQRTGLAELNRHSAEYLAAVNTALTQADRSVLTKTDPTARRIRGEIKQLRRQRLETSLARLRHAHAQCPKRLPLTIF